MGKDLLRYRDVGQTISFGDINEALGLTRGALRTIGDNNTMAYTASFYRLPSTPYLHRVSNGGIPKVSQWYNYYDRQIGWRGLGTGTCVIDTSSLITPSVVIGAGDFKFDTTSTTPYLISNTGTGKVYTFNFTGINGTNYSATNVAYSGTYPTNVGHYQATLYVAADGLYNAGVSNTVSWNITPETPVVTPIVGNNIANNFSINLGPSGFYTYYTYNGSPQGPNTAINTYGGSVDGQTGLTINSLTDVPGYSIWTNNKFATGTNYTFIYSSDYPPLWGPTTSLPTLPGSYKVTSTVAADGNFNASTSIRNWTINYLTPIVTPTVGTYIYDGSPQGPTTGTNTGTGTTYINTRYVGINSTNYASSPTKPTNVGTYQVTMTVDYSADFIYSRATGIANFDILNTFRVSIYPDGSSSTGTNFVDYFKLTIFTNQMWDIDIKIYTYGLQPQYIGNYTIASSTKVINSLNPLEYKFTSTQIGGYAAGYYTIVITQISTSYSVTRYVSTLG